MFDSHTSCHGQKILKYGDCLAKISRLHLTTPNFGQNILLEIRAILKWQVVAVPYKDPRTQPRGEELLASPSRGIAPGIDAHIDEFESYVEIARESEEFEIVHDSEEGKPDVVVGGAGGCSGWQHSVQGAGGPAAGLAVIKSILFTHRHTVG